MEARFEPLRTNPIMIALSGSFEHRQWPIHNDEALEIYGDTEFMVLAGHFSSLSCMASFDLSEAKVQWRRVMFETRNAPFFSMKFTS